MENQTTSPTALNDGKSLRYAWFVVFILMLANISSFIDRQILALLVTPIKRDLHLSDTQISLLMGLSFALFYTFFGVLVGYFSDKFNRRNIIIAGITVWSLMTALCASARSYGQFFLVRMGVGVGEATLAPSAYSMITDYFPKNKLSTALSTYSMGIFLGSGLALLIGAGLVAGLPTSGTTHVPILGDIFHWQILFIYIGLPGLLIALLLFSIKEPTRKDLNTQQTAAAASSLREALNIIWSKRKAYLFITFGVTFGAFGSYGSTAWVPTFFVRTFGWQMREIGFKFGLLITVFSALGVLAGGWMADRYIRQGRADGRMRVGLQSGVVLTLSAVIFLFDNPNLVLAALAIPAFFLAYPFGAAVQEIMPNRVRGLASSIFLFILNMIALGGGPLVVALFTDYIFKNELLLKYSLVALYLIGGLLSTLFFALAFKPYRDLVAEK
jgi:MFS family permease